MEDSGGEQYSCGDFEGEEVQQAPLIHVVATSEPKDLTKVHPQQNIFRYGNLKFCSVFDSGNLGNCKPREGEHNSYDCWISGDSQPYFKYGQMRTWFYFYVEGFGQGQEITFVIKNMAFQTILYKSGMRPVYKNG